MTGLASVPLDQIASATGVGLSSSSGAAATTTQAAELLVGAITGEGDSVSQSPADPGNQRHPELLRPGSNPTYTAFPGVGSATGPGLFGMYCIVNGTGAYVAQGTFGGPPNPAWEAVLATYKALRLRRSSRRAAAV